MHSSTPHPDRLYFLIVELFPLFTPQLSRDFQFSTLLHFSPMSLHSIQGLTGFYLTVFDYFSTYTNDVAKIKKYVEISPHMKNSEYFYSTNYYILMINYQQQFHSPSHHIMPRYPYILFNSRTV